MKYIPAGIFAAIGAFFFLATFAGDNVDARALSGIMIFPAIVFEVLAIIAAGVAYVL